VKYRITLVSTKYNASYLPFSDAVPNVERNQKYSAKALYVLCKHDGQCISRLKC